MPNSQHICDILPSRQRSQDRPRYQKGQRRCPTDFAYNVQPRQQLWQSHYLASGLNDLGSKHVRKQL